MPPEIKEADKQIPPRIKTTSVQRKTLTEQVTEAIFDHILNHMREGDELPSTEKLAVDFQVSRIVIREALKTLEAHGIVDINSGKKAIIRPVNGDIFKIYFQRVFFADIKNFLELMEFRKAIETFCVEMASQRRTDEEFRSIETIFKKMEASLTDYIQYTHYDLDFHIAIASASHNSVLEHVITSLREVIKNSIENSFRNRLNDESLQTSLGYHRQIIEAFRNKDTEAAKSAITAHFNDAFNFFSHRTSEKKED